MTPESQLRQPPGARTPPDMMGAAALMGVPQAEPDLSASPQAAALAGELDLLRQLDQQVMALASSPEISDLMGEVSKLLREAMKVKVTATQVPEQPAPPILG